MGYWSDRDQDGPPKSAEGWHLYTVSKVLRGTQSGRTFESKSGDPQILVVLQDEEGAEASTMFTLSDKASWVLARFLARAEVELSHLDEEGVSLSAFEDERFAERWLKGLKAWGNCEHQNGNDGKVYTKVNFFHESEVPASSLARKRGGSAEGSEAEHAQPVFSDGAPVPDDDDIPF